MKLDRLILWSAGLNVILAGICGYFFLDRQDRGPLPPQIVSQCQASVPIGKPPALSKLQWQQLEADDYPTYIANLRATGIPESTLRTIISAEVATEFEQRRQEIAAQPGATEFARYQKWQRLEQLPREQATVVASLLSTQPARAAYAGYSTSNESTQFAPGEAATATEDSPPVVTMVPVLDPAVLVPADPATPLTEQQVSEWEKLQDDFVAAVGGPNQDPDDPAYSARWKEAQRVSDQMFRLKFGTVAFLRQNAEAGRRGKRE